MRLSNAIVMMLLGGLSHAVPAQPLVCQQGIDALKAERIQAAIDPLTQCLKQDLPAPARAFILQMRARAYGELKQWRAAIDDQRRFIAAFPPSDVWPHVMLAAYLREDGQLDESLDALDAARGYDEDGPGTGPGMAVYFHKAKTLYLLGRHRDAIESLTVGIGKQPDYGPALYQRALSYEALGDKVQAKRDLFRAGQLTPKGGYEEKIRDKLREYGFTDETAKP